MIQLDFYELSLEGKRETNTIYTFVNFNVKQHHSQLHWKKHASKRVQVRDSVSGYGGFLFVLCTAGQADLLVDCDSTRHVANRP